MRSLYACLLLAAAPAAHAAFYVSDGPPPSPVVMSAPAAARNIPTDDPTVHKIPFAARSTQLSWAAKRALQRILPVAQSVPQVVVSGCGEGADSDVTAYRRASEVKAWLLSNGISDEAVKVRTGNSASTVRSGNTFQCLISFTDTPTASATIAPSQKPAPVLQSTAAPMPMLVPRAPTQSDPRIWMVQSVLEMVAAKTLKADDAIAMLDRIIKTGVTAPAAAPVLPASAPAAPPAQIQAAMTPTILVVPAAPAEWVLRADSTLQAAIEDWSRQAGWKPPVWRASNPFKVATGGTLRGSYLDALRDLSKAVPQLDFTVSTDGKTLIVTDAKTAI
ncbi:TcpQ domain-containing protein [Cupriavidus pauculus]|uniref:TcpQ domain-containing protein n=1 Tax=Cupriavidus pauculus TaxID=82633 RepID=UPI0038575C00